MWKATGSYRTYSIPGKTAALVPEFAVVHLPSAELQPRFLHLQRRTCPWAEHFDDDDDDDDDDVLLNTHLQTFSFLLKPICPNFKEILLDILTSF